MIVEILAEAREELIGSALLWYEAREPGLGMRFRNEISHIIERIAEDPLLWRERSDGHRRVNCPVFPFYVAYFIRGRRVIIAAIAHGHRKPGYWKTRNPA